MDGLLPYMKSRRSSLSLCLTEPGPTEEQLQSILEIATRVPDHGKLAPWRIVLWTPQTRREMHSQLLEMLNNKPDVLDREKKQKGTDKILHAPCVLAVISTASEHPKIPQWEQHLSAGAVCMNTLIAANAVGLEAQWLTAWYVYENEADEILGLKPGERIAGIIHIGSSETEKNERPRPEINSIFSIR